MALGWELGVHDDFIVITHEQWALISFLSWGSLELILVNFP
jgi:hypothetical protein